MENKQLSKRKLKWFKVFTLAFPILILLFVELLLRLFGYGHNTELFIRYPDNPDYYVINKYASERYFSDTTNETTGNIEPFKVKKQPNTLRIFVLGESTTAGYPYFHNGSFHRWLEYRLIRTYPDVHFEIINVSLTAVNSYTVLDFGKQVLQYQPDAVLVYTGHNEYYGALGVGSTSHIANNRFLVKTVLQLRRLRLVQLIENGITGIKKMFSGKVTDTRENLMKRMAASQEIAYGSDDYKAGIQQFQANMDELCQIMQDKGIPMFLSTLVSNEKDQKPFISAGSTGSADAQFSQGNASYAAGNYALAKQQYVKAKELDMLRFRAPESMNQVIGDLAAKYTNVHLVNARQIFEAYSPHQILGNETLLEHVHPNLYGYALLSDAFYQSIEKSGLIKAKATHELLFSDLLSQMPVTKVDSLYGAYTIMMLQSGWPFNKPIPADFKRGGSIDEQLAGAISVGKMSWLDAINQLFQNDMKLGDKKNALKAVEAVSLEYPLNTTYKIYAGRLCFDLGDKAGAYYYLKGVYDLDPSFANTQDMFLVCLKTDQPEKAITYIKSAIQMQPQNMELTVLLTTSQKIIQLKNKLAQSPNDTATRQQVGVLYHSIGFDDAAGNYK